MALVDQQRLRTIVEIDENDSYTTHSSSSCFTSPSLNDSPPAIRRLQTLSLAPRPTYDPWNSGIYSPSDPNETTTLNRKLTLNSDSGRESVDSSFSSENELSPPIKRYTTKALTIYEIEKAKKGRSSTLPREKTRDSYTVSTKVFINENENLSNLDEQKDVQTEPSTTVLKIYIPPAVEKNVAERFAKHKEALSKTTPFRMDISSPSQVGTQERIVTPKYGVDLSGYRVTAWETQSKKEPGRIANFKPEVDRWHEKVEDGGAKAIKRGSRSSIASSSLFLGAEIESSQDTGNTLSDVSSCTSLSEAQEVHTPSDQSIAPSNASTKGSKDVDSVTSGSPSKSSQSSKIIINDEEKSLPPTSTTKESSKNMLQDRIVEVGVRPWKSQSVEKFTSKPSNGPQLLSEKSKKKVIFPSESLIDQQQHVYENIDDCRDRGVEHPRKILPMPEKRLPFRQSARVPVLTVPSFEPLMQSESEGFDDVGPEISYVSYRFYDKNMQEQNSLSHRCSAQLLRTTATRLSLSRPKSNSTNRKYTNVAAVQPRQPPSFAPNKHPIEPLRYQTASDRTERTLGQLKDKVEDDSLVTVSGTQTCANCHFRLGRGQAMTIDSLGLFYHLHCFRCADCGALLSQGNSKGMEVRVCGTKIQCNQCYNFADIGLHYSRI